MKKLLKRFMRNNEGVAAIEFSLTFVFFITSLLLIVELSRVAILSSALDLSVAEAVKKAKNTDLSAAGGGDYLQIAKKNLEEQLGIWSFLEREQSTQIEAVYAKDVADLLGDKTQKTASSDYPLAQYTFTYNYDPMFIWFPRSLVEQLTPVIFIRRVVVIQEYERKRQ